MVSRRPLPSTESDDVFSEEQDGGDRDLVPRRNERDIALYVAHMTSEMAAMARAARFELLAYFLDMARIEANLQAGRREE